MGRIAEEYRLPMAPLTEKNRQTLKAALQKFRLLKS
jgi:dihydrodipicolinate synthase/N-acetylneuraminate lyase